MLTFEEVGYYLRKKFQQPVHDINIIGIGKDQRNQPVPKNQSEFYFFVYTDAERAECLRTLGRFASNPDLSFQWYDAAVLSQRVRAEKEKTEKDKPGYCPRKRNRPIDISDNFD